MRGLQTSGSPPPGAPFQGPLNGLRACKWSRWFSTPAPSRSRNRCTACANAGCASQCALWAGTGSSARAILCSPWAPPSNRATPWARSEERRVVRSGRPGRAEGGGRPPGGGGGRQGQRRAGHLVLALGAAFKPRHAMGYAPLQGLVVAGLEMQAIDPLERAPVTAISHQIRGLARVLARRLVRAGAGFIGAQRYQTAGHGLAVGNGQP